MENLMQELKYVVVYPLSSSASDALKSVQDDLNINGYKMLATNVTNDGKIIHVLLRSRPKNDASTATHSA